ncbi:MAG: single-stranded DNA-binding protein [Bacteroidales bacterium]|jgi:single-strand DNA-binding protein|nr:single-stranded DNA-binding protein [Bacteroidales bacterium]
MAGINKVLLIGNVAEKPDILMFNGKKKAIFSLATNRKTKEKNEDTQWHNIICWQHLADIAEQYVKKGVLIYVEGSLNYRKWEDRNGLFHRETEIIAEKIQILSSFSREHQQEETLAQIVFGEQPMENSNITEFINNNETINPFDDIPL